MTLSKERAIKNDPSSTLKIIERLKKEIQRLQSELAEARGEGDKRIREAYYCGYDYGHHSTVEGLGYYPDEAADEYMDEIREDNDKEQTK